MALKDSVLFNLIKTEEKRQHDFLNLIPSENYVSKDVLNALGSVLTNKYSEGYPGKRYYGGNSIVDEIENLAIERAKALFDVPYANVQPYSGSPANLAVCFAILKPGDSLMGMDLKSGGHLSHGWKQNFSSIYYKSIPYHVDDEGKVDIKEVATLASLHKPKLIWVGGSAYTKSYEFKEFSKIAEDSGAYLVADISHVAGLIAGGVHPSPVPYVDFITTTTHKTLRGPRGAIICVTQKGLRKNKELPELIDKAIIPGLQGGPHNNVTAAIAVALHEASTIEFKNYASQVIKNAQVLSKVLMKSKLNLVGNGTENHLMLVDLAKTHSVGSGYFAEYALGLSGIIVNKNIIPNDKSNPFYTSGIRLGSPALTSRSMMESEMLKVGDMITNVLSELQHIALPEDKNERQTYVAFQKEILNNNVKFKLIKRDVLQMCKMFPIRPDSQ